MNDVSSAPSKTLLSTILRFFLQYNDPKDQGLFLILVLSKYQIFQNNNKNAF